MNAAPAGCIPPLDLGTLSPRTLDASMTRQWSNLVVNHYPPQHGPPAAERTRSEPHTDIGGLALLVQAGDLLTRWTGGRIPSNLHRVVNPPPGSDAARAPPPGSDAARAGRYPVACFHHPDMVTTITGEDGQELVAAEHGRRRPGTPVDA